jgi:transcriptional regulator with GAF, ATPase, and Fis domain
MPTQQQAEPVYTAQQLSSSSSSENLMTTTAARLTLMPEARFRPLAPALRHHLLEVGSSISAENFASLLDDLMRHMLDFNFRAAGADEGSVWIADHTDHKLHAAYNTGPHQEFVGKFSKPLNAGLLSMVFATERPFVQNHMAGKSAGAAKEGSLDNELKVETAAMIAVPLHYLDEIRGVISCVKLAGNKSDKADAFSEPDQARIRYLAATLGRMIDLRVLRSVVGLHEGH